MVGSDQVPCLGIGLMRPRFSILLVRDLHRRGDVAPIRSGARLHLHVFEFFSKLCLVTLQLDSFLDGTMFRPDNLSLFETNSALSRGMKLLQTLQYVQTLPIFL